MEMETEIIVVLIASLASLVIGVVNIIFNARISAKQNDIELKKTRIDLLETRRQKIEAVKTEISNRIIDVKDSEFDKHLPRMVEYFQKTSSNLFSIGHLLDRNLIIELKSLCKVVDKFILDAKKGVQIGDDEAQKAFVDMYNICDQVDDKLDESLKIIEDEINRVLG